MPELITTTTDVPDRATGAAQPIFLLAVLVVATVFFAAEQYLGQSRLLRDALSTSEFSQQKADRVATGSLERQLAYPLLAALGIIFLLRRSGRRWRVFDPMALTILLYVAWSVASLLWSSDPVLTTKRGGVLVLAFVGALGVSRQLSGRQLAVLALCVTAIYVVVGLAAEIALGTFRPWAGEYRFAGTLHPNHQGPYCACLCLAAACLVRHPGRNKQLLYLAAFAGVALLLLTKSRASAAALVAGLLAVWFFTSSTRVRMVTGMAAVWAVSVSLFCVSLLGTEKQLVNFAMLGRPEKLDTLTGRVPLWNELLTYVEARPLLGYGYDSFWSPERITDISLAVGWAINSAHSAYLEALLSGGLVGSALLSVAVLMACWRARASYRDSRDPGSAFVLAFLAFSVVHGLLESVFVRPTFVPFIAGVGLLQLAFWHQLETPAADGAQDRVPFDPSRDDRGSSPEESN